MKYLGIDYGAKRMGLAVSDDRGVLAFAYQIIENNHEMYDRLSTIIKDENIQEIVVGESVDSEGNPNAVMKHIENFIKQLSQKTLLPIHLEKEWMSSVAARSPLYTKGNIANESWSGTKNKQKKAAIDDKAAAVILQRFLDKKK